MHKPELFPENEMDKIIRDFEIQVDKQIQAIWPDQKLVNTVNFPSSGFFQKLRMNQSPKVLVFDYTSN